ncbi:MAG: hypothetical protein J6L69_08605 [Lachnospiraceae bacterium]|nr:hypothetical protein [Lachnospiraceae bacterium]
MKKRKQLSIVIAMITILVLLAPSLAEITEAAVLTTSSLTTGMVKANGEWLYYTNGELDTSYTGMAKNEYGWFYIKNGQLDRTFTELQKMLMVNGI